MESVDPRLSDDWACLARLGFAASEAGDQNRGRELVERALQQRPQAPYVIHSYAHVLHDQGNSAASCGIQAAAGDAAALEQSRAAIAIKESSDQTRLSLKLVDAVSRFARGQYADAADTLRSVSADERVGVGGSHVERMLIDLLEDRAVELAA